MRILFTTLWLSVCIGTVHGQIVEDSRGASTTNAKVGDAFTDTNNPIYQLFQGKRLELWSLRPIQKPNIPQPTFDNWSRNPIDRFLLSDWQKSGGTPCDDAPPQDLVRRLSFHLTGLPPSYDRCQDFLTDASDLQWEQLVDAWLASPRYGEHWARMWLDVVRYSDSNGFDWDEFRPQAWRYRDYVVGAWNCNLPFDQFVLEQLAGDEMVNGQPKDSVDQRRWIATGYLRMGPYDNAAKLFNEQDRARVEVLSDLTETTGSAFLGLTLACCRCHDHKTEPLSHADHYRFRAFFAATRFAEDQSLELEKDHQELERHNQQLTNSIEKLSKDLEKWFEQVALDNQVGEIEYDTKNEEKKKKQRLERIRKSMNEGQKEDLQKRERMIEELRGRIRKPSTGILMTDHTKNVDPIHVLYQGDHRQIREEVQPGFPSVLDPNTPSLEQPISRSTTGRRWTLAKWIVDTKNPWTARVIVNRIWQMHFGAGIVETPNDFGWTGTSPTHPELLDYLASELIESGWSIKHLQRLIVTSHAYRMKSLTRTTDTIDAKGNRMCSSRSGLYRLSAESLRDSLLEVCDQLRYISGGPPIWPTLSKEVLQANPAVLDDNETKTKGWYPSPANEQSVRSIYLIQKRTLRLPWMETFDQPENAVSCPRRETSIVAPQALTLMNGELSLSASMRLSKQLSEETAEQSSQISEAFRRILAREPKETEMRACRAFLKNQTLAELINVLLNSNEFVFIP